MRLILALTLSCTLTTEAALAQDRERKTKTVQPNQPPDWKPPAAPPALADAGPALGNAPPVTSATPGKEERSTGCSMQRVAPTDGAPVTLVVAACIAWLGRRRR